MGIHTLNALTVKKIESSKAKKLRDGGGLWLVTKGRGRYWILDYRCNGKRRELGLGPLHTVGLAEARERAGAARDLLKRGIDPIEHRHGVEAIEAAKAKAAVKTFGEYADEYIDEAVKVGRWRGAKTEAGWRNTLRNHAASIREKAIRDIDTDDVLKVLRPIWGVKQETAEKLRERLEQVLDAAKVEKLRTGENPAAWKGNLEHVLQKPDELTTKENYPALPWRRLPAFMAKLAEIDSTAARCLEFAILTGRRSGEPRNAKWSQIEDGTWNVPAPRTKGGKPGKVPLSPQALAVLKAVPRFEGNDLIFPGERAGKPLSDMTLSKIIKSMHAAEQKAGRAGWVDPHRLDEDGQPRVAVPHGFRSTLKDWCTDATEHPYEISEMVLSHVVGDTAARAYARSEALEKRRKLLVDWANFCVKSSQNKEID